MKTNIQVLTQLAKELIAICNDQGTDVFALTDDTEGLIKGTLKDERVFAVDFAIYAEKYDSILKKLSEMSGRVTETLRTNSGMPGIGIRYSDPETVFFDPELPGQYLCNGLHINILPLIRRPKKTIGDKIINYEERLWERKNESALGSLYFKVLGEKRMGRNLLDKQLKRSKSAKGKYTLHFPGGAICDITKKDIKEAETIAFGELFVRRFPKASNAFQRFNKRHDLAKKYSLMSARASWDDMMKLSGGTFTLNRKQYLKAIRKREGRYLQAKRDVEKNWNIIEITYDRFRYYDQYCNDKERHMEMFRNGEYEALRSELSEYIDSLEFYSRRNLAICFDADYLGMALKIIKDKNGLAMARKILDSVKREHLESVGEYLKRLETGEPLNMETCNDRYDALSRSLGETV